MTMLAMLRSSSRPYVCQRCLGRIQYRFSSENIAGSVALDRFQPSLRASQKIWTSSQSTPESRNLFGQSNVPKSPPQHELGGQRIDQLPIRERLRLWAAQQATQSSDAMPPDVLLYGSVANSLSRTQSTGSAELDQLRSTEGAMADDPEGGVDNGDAETTVTGVGSRAPGDLVELRQSGSRVPLFAIYLGSFGDRNHFYAVNGRWITSMGFSSLFTVSRFVSLAELAPVLSRMPKNATPEEFEEIRTSDNGPSREDGAQLVTKMTEFRLKAEAVYQANLSKLDAARTLLPSSRHVQHLSLSEMADMLLPATLKEGRYFPPPALYAVHTALYRNEAGFRPLSSSKDCNRQDHLFEVSPQARAHTINKVATMVRDYTDSCSRRLRAPNPDELEETHLGKFILQARKAIETSRLEREWTSHGILKPSTDVVRLKKVEWTQASRDILSFLEWWSSYDLFEPGSRFHGYGSLVLRALQVYDDASLDQSTAWTFLQEIGVISPWEVPSRSKTRLPGTNIVRGGGLSRETPDDIENSKRLDVAEGFRKEHNKAPIFAIDGPSTMVIDDGISLERTENPDEFWIHVHAADPASSIKPNSELCKFMELIPENIYLPGHFQAMLPSDLGEDDSNDFKSEGLVKQFSLRTGSPALTFSAKVNEAGSILDYKIEPSTLGDVIYMDPTDVADFCDEPSPPPVPEHVLTVGTPPTNGKIVPKRSIITAKDLDQSSKDDILTLYRLAEALRKQRLSKGAWPYFFPRPSVSVSFAKIPSESTTESNTILLPADPYIKVAYEQSTGCSIVSNTMVLAGEVAAQWCSARGIPIPYRRDIKTGANSSEAFKYATEEIYPLISQGVEPSMNQRQSLARITGGVEISPRAGPYFLLGLDMYTKTTSPLRRFSDLLVHWQIHAALAHERQSQRALDPAIDELDEILPFSADALAETFPLLAMREKMARTVSRGSLEWIHMALARAWRFEGSAPRSYRFTVGSRWRQGFLGRIDLFDLGATMDIAGLNACALAKDIDVGDQFEVELADVNVHSRQILVKALRYLGDGKQQQQQQQQQL